MSYTLVSKRVNLQYSQVSRPSWNNYKKHKVNYIYVHIILKKIAEWSHFSRRPELQSTIRGRYSGVQCSQPADRINCKTKTVLLNSHCDWTHSCTWLWKIQTSVDMLRLMSLKEDRTRKHHRHHHYDSSSSLRCFILELHSSGIT